jgi:hypothetical protein
VRRRRDDDGGDAARAGQRDPGPLLGLAAGPPEGRPRQGTAELGDRAQCQRQRQVQLPAL